MENHEGTQHFSEHFDWKFSRVSSSILFEQLAFLFFADTKLILTETEKETVENVSTKLMKNAENLLEDLSVSLKFQYKKNIYVNNGIVLAPLFEFQISDLKPQFMDFKIQVHDNEFDAKKTYSESGYSSDFQLENINESESHIFFSGLSSPNQYLQIDIDFFVRPILQTAEKIISYFNDIKTDDLKKSIKDVKRLIRRFYLQSTIDCSDVDKIIDCLKPQLNTEIINTLLEGFREVTGERRFHLGNAFFIKDILHIILCNNNFELKIEEYSNLKVKNFLTLQAKAFVQLKEEEKNDLFDPNEGKSVIKLHAKAFVQLKEKEKNDLFDPKEGKSVISSYRLVSDKELDDAKAKLSDELLKFGEFFKTMDLSPFQIKRLHTVITNTCNSNNTYIDLGIELARKLGAKTFDQFVAVLEYGAALLNDKKIEIDKEDKKANPPETTVSRRSKNQIKREIRKGIITDEEGKRLIEELKAKSNPVMIPQKSLLERAAEFIRDNMEQFCEDFQKLADLYEKEYSIGQKYNFADPMLAAYHFVKHAKEYDKKYGNSSLTFGKYITIARNMLSCKNIESTWEQEGNVRRFQVRDEVEARTAIRRDDVIATLVFKLL